MNIRKTDRGFGHTCLQSLTTLMSMPVLTISVLSIVVLLTACASVLNVYRDTAIRNHWQESLVNTSLFAHRVWMKPAKHQLKSVKWRSNALHIYIEGDGQAWLTPATPSRDPTPIDGLMFRLMALDDAASVYIGRPCYFDTHDDHCDVRWWTFQRYHPDIVASMVSAIETTVQRQCLQQPCTAPRITLIGHSGGGTLSVLAASHLQHVAAVVTIAGNLDTEAWVNAHEYLPLAGSLNPAMEAALPGSIKQIHLVAQRDEIIPAGIIESYCRRQVAAANVSCLTIPGTTHNSGWEQRWPALLAQYVMGVDQP